MSTTTIPHFKKPPFPLSCRQRSVLWKGY